MTPLSDIFLDLKEVSLYNKAITNKNLEQIKIRLIQITCKEMFFNITIQTNAAATTLILLVLSESYFFVISHF